MSLSKKVRSFLWLFDAYSSPFKIKFSQKTLFQTNYGGIISFIFYAIILAAFVFLYVLLHKKEEQKIISFDLRYNEPAKLVLNFDSDNIVYSKNITNSVFFLIGFYMVDKSDKKILNDTEIEQNFKIKLRERSRKNENITDEEFYEYKNCETAFPKEVALLKNPFLKNAFCIQTESIDLQGEFLTMSEENPFNYLSISLTGKQSNIEVEKYLFTLFYTDYSINNKIHNHIAVGLIAHAARGCAQNAGRDAAPDAQKVAMDMGVDGIKVHAAGRINGAEIARVEWSREGAV